ncbi:hypothetical protein F5B21DRAFT_503908 [Xylaria acuta]|nr:hypothetical protein F5B21DRAFT_503908 [Xylaria acuta]
MTIFFTLSTIVSDIVEIVKIVRRRMPLALYIDFASQKTLLYAIYLLSGLVFASPILTIVGGIMSITSFIQLLHGVRIGGKMRKQGIAMTDEYELVLSPAGADHLEAGYNETGAPDIRGRAVDELR